MKPKYIDEKTVQEILDNSNLVNYFLYLADKGRVTFWRRYGKEFYFLTDTEKFCVSEDGEYYDHKNEVGGKIVKAVQYFEGLNWLESIHFINEFNKANNSFFVDVSDNIKEEKSNLKENTYLVTFVTKPNNPALIDYFARRGISKDTLIKFARQIHYQIRRKGEDQTFHYFGIGWQNHEGGYDIRNENMATKLGTGSYTFRGNKESKSIIVFEGMCDLFSMIEILKMKGRDYHDYGFVCLNSVSNANKFLADYRSSEATFSLCLDGDAAGGKTTSKILCAIPNSKDVRSYFKISKDDFKDLNDYWKDYNDLHT